MAAAGWEALVPTARGERAFYFFAGFISIITVVLIQSKTDAVSDLQVWL